MIAYRESEAVAQPYRQGQTICAAQAVNSYVKGSPAMMQVSNTKAARLAVGLAWAVLLSQSGSAAGTEAGKLPEWPQVVQTVRQHFAAAEQPPWMILSRDQAAAVLERLAQLGLRPADREQILQQIPAAEEFLVAELRTPQGRQFMADIAAYPGAYDRLDRLSRLPRGKQMVRDLIRGPDGYKLIEYLTTAPNGHELGRQLSRTPKGKQFNQPTGRIYTEAMLLERLHQSYDALRAGGSGKGLR